MMKTVAEANKTVCYRGAGNETAFVCRADICMAWRWQKPWQRPVGQWLWQGEKRRQSRKGYCGAVGKPSGGAL